MVAASRPQPRTPDRMGGGTRQPWSSSPWRLLSLALGTIALARHAMGSNCFSLVEESQWSLIISHNASQAAISLAVSGAGPEVLTCLHRQPDTLYRYQHLLSCAHSEGVPHLLCLSFLAWPKKAAIKRYCVLTDKKKNFFVDSGPGGVNGGVHFTR